MKLLLPLLLIAAAAPSARAAYLPGEPADVMCFHWSMKYNYCYAVLKSDTYTDMASKEASCAAKNPGGGPDSWKTQTECCKVHGGCGYSGGPGGRTCWAPDFAAKRCVEWRLDDPKAACNTGLAGGFQYQRICENESFGVGNAVQNRMAPLPVMNDKMAPVPAVQDKMAPKPAAQVQDKMAPRPAAAVQDKMAPGTTIEIKYSGKANTDLGGADIPSGGQAFSKVCGGVTKIIVACNQNKNCAAFTVESKDISNPNACGYLKRAGGKLSARNAWTAFVRS